jgi:hypothetical protein
MKPDDQASEPYHLTPVDHVDMLLNLLRCAEPSMPYT